MAETGGERDYEKIYHRKNSEESCPAVHAGPDDPAFAGSGGLRYGGAGYGAALASEITYDIMPDGNQVPLQRIIWKYDSPPTAKQLAQDARSRRTIQIPESAALVKKSGLEQIIPPTGMAEDNISPWMGRMFCALRIMEIPLLTVR